MRVRFEEEGRKINLIIDNCLVHLVNGNLKETRNSYFCLTPIYHRLFIS